MRFIATADTDIGIRKNTNQDSCLIKHASTDIGEVLLAIVCDGMGGLAKGELASATVIRAFSDWFNNELPYELSNLDMSIIGEKWSLLLKDLNAQILGHSASNGGSNMGTTFSGVLFVNNEYLTKKDDVIEVPLLGKITAGSPIEAIERPNEYISLPAYLKPKQK